MDIAFAFFSEHAQVTVDGRLNVLGMDIRTLQGPAFPLVVPSIFFVAKVIFEPREREGNHKFTVSIIGPDGAKVDPFIDMEAVSPPPVDPELKSAFLAVVQIGGMAFSTPGIYRFPISVDGTELSKVGLLVKQLDQAVSQVPQGQQVE